MSGYKNFAVAGAGNIGAFVVEQLLNAKAMGIVNDVVVLTRTGSTKTFPGARVIPVDYSDKEGVGAALAGVDVVVSGISPYVLGVQASLGEAAKAAGVNSAGGGLYGIKDNIRAQMKAISLPVVIFHTGLWPDWLFNGLLELDLPNGRAVLGGDGNEPMSWTSRTDTARFVVHILTTLPAERLENGLFRCEADRKSFNEIVKLYEAKTGRKVQVEYIPVSTLAERFKANPNDLLSYLKLSFISGVGLVGEPENYLFPGFNPAPAIDCIPLPQFM
ncbi:NAD-P-binding protein [Gloeopeniophorella convolvens]|nr:NAD-P-binding protein [Gloeopeniophorella convolvens]